MPQELVTLGQDFSLSTYMVPPLGKAHFRASTGTAFNLTHIHTHALTGRSKARKRAGFWLPSDLLLQALLGYQQGKDAPEPQE